MTDRQRAAFAAVSILAVAYVVYFRGFAWPALVIWDEAYYVAEAQKYLHGVFFADLHPPLGKLLVAAGEKWFGENAVTTQFLDTTWWTTFPPGISFVGYRLLPVLLATLTPLVLFAAFRRIAGDVAIAAMLCGFYLFDNALVVHLRSAMLEGPLLFFGAWVLLAFVAVDAAPERRVRAWSLVAGLALGAALATKAIGAIFVLPAAALAWRAGGGRRTLGAAAIVAAAALVVVAGAWEAHFTIARRVNPVLREQGFYYPPSPASRAFLEGTAVAPVSALPALVLDAARYTSWYDRARPALDLCNPNDHGSPFWMWPIGARAVPYQWQDAGGGRFRYLYLQSNPVVWFTGLASVVAALWLLASSAIGWRPPLRHPFRLRVVTCAYFAYFAPFPFIHGVMFLYHYFIPLVFSFFLLASIAAEFGAGGARRERARAIAAVWLACVVAGFWVYKPLTYFEPLSADQIARRAIVTAWDLRCILCPARRPAGCGARP